MVDFTGQNGNLTSKNDGLTSKNGGFTSKNGEFTSKNGETTTSNSDLPWGKHTKKGGKPMVFVRKMIYKWRNNGIKCDYTTSNIKLGSSKIGIHGRITQSCFRDNDEWPMGMYFGARLRQFEDVGVHQRKP